MQRCFFNIISRNLEASKAFYINVLGMQVHFDSDWFVIVKPDTESAFELGIIAADHEVVPAQVAGKPSGLYSTMVVDDVEVVHRRAIEQGAPVIEPPTLMFYGQKRMLLQDPDGVTVDVSSLASS